MLALVDQAGLTLASFGLLTAVARAVPTDSFGRFALLQALLILPTAAFRATIGTAILVVHPERIGTPPPGTSPQHPANLQPILRLAVLLSLLAAVGVVVLLPAGGNLSTELAFGAVAYLTGSFLVDACRYVAYARDRVGVAALISLSTLAAPVVAWLAVPRLGWHAGFLAFSLVLAATAGLISGALLWRSRAIESLSMTQLWRAYRRTTRELGLLFTVTTSTQLLLPYLLLPVAGLQVVGNVRAGQSAAGLGLQVPQGLQPLLLAASARRHRRRGRFDTRPLLSWLTCLTVSVAVLVLVIRWLPDEVGRQLLGQTWDVARDLIVVFAVSGGLVQAATGLETYFRTVQRLGPVIRLRLVLAPSSLALAAIGGWFHATAGAALGLLMGNGALALGSLVLLVRDRRTHPPREV